MLRHTIRLSDSSKIAVHNSNLELLDQPNFSNIPITHLDYINEVGTRLTIEEANKLPLFVAFQFGQAHHRPWRTKGKNSGSIWRKEHNKLGYYISVNQIIFAQPDLIPHMSVFLTSEKLLGCTTFVDHVNDFVYVHLMIYVTLLETLWAKSAFEKVFAQAGRTAVYYHSDNGQFS